MRWTLQSLVGVGLLALFFACARPAPLPEPEPPPPAVAAVEVVLDGGFAGPPDRGPAGPLRVDLLLDITPSMRAPLDQELVRLDAAKVSAERFLGSLPPDVEVAMHTLGLTQGAACSDPEYGDAMPPGASRDEAVRALRSARPRSESSLAGALVGASQRIRREGAADRSRIVLFTDLGGECGGDLCAAVAEVVGAGIPLHTVRFGGVPVPDCLEALPAAEDLPQVTQATQQLLHPAFRVEAGGPDEGPGSEIARGQAGAGPVTVPPGPVRVVAEMDPPLVIGPLTLNPGGLTRIRILSFPALADPVREWWIEHEESPGGLAPAVSPP